MTSLEALDSNLSLVGNMETMRIDIVVSEHGKADKKRSKSKNRAKLILEVNTGVLIFYLYLNFTNKIN